MKVDFLSAWEKNKWHPIKFRKQLGFFFPTLCYKLYIYIYIYIIINKSCSDHNKLFDIIIK